MWYHNAAMDAGDRADAAVDVERVDAGYPGVPVLRNVTFSVRRGEIFLLLGGSGCGKSTLMRHLTGLTPPLAGRIAVCGMEWTPRSRAALCRKIGVMYQSGALFGSMSCLENVMLPLETFTRDRASARRKKALELLAAVGMADAADKPPSELSGGMKKRAAIARAMALDPEVVFLDEPEAGLDPIAARSLDDLLLRLRGERGTTFIAVTHELPGIFRIGDRCAVFDAAAGGMVALGPPRRLAENPPDPFTAKFFGCTGRDGGGKD